MKFKRIDCLCVALSLLILGGCGDKQTQPDKIPTEKAVASCGVVKDPWGVASAWAVSPGEQAADVQELLASWENPTVARLWRVDDARTWSALIASKPEPGAAEKVILLTITYAADGPNYALNEVKVGSATELWPEL